MIQAASAANYHRGRLTTLDEQLREHDPASLLRRPCVDKPRHPLVATLMAEGTNPQLLLNVGRPGKGTPLIRFE